MRFALYLLLLFSVVPFVFLRPFFGLCVYYVVSLLQPKYLCWRGDFQDAIIVGVPLVIGAVAFGVRRIIVTPRIARRSGRVTGILQRVIRAPLFEFGWPLIVLVLLLLYISINRAIAPFPMDNSTYQYRSLLKVALVAALITGMAADLRRFRTLYIVIGLSAAFWAIKGGMKVILLGPHQVYGKNYDNNVFALVSVMALPMVFYFGLSVRTVRWRTLLLVASALISLAIIGSRSRAGFAAFVVVVICMAWNSRYRIRAAVAVCLLGAVALFTAGAEVRERIDSIINYEQDISARGRLATWDQAYFIFTQYPLTGVGFNNFERARTYYFGGTRAAHNIYLQNLAELGLVGHPLWLILILGTLFSLYRFMRRCRRLPPNFRWAYYLSRGIVLATLGFCIHGAFHNEEYLEYFFAVVGLAVALRAATARELHAHRLMTALESGREARPSTSKNPAGAARPIPIPAAAPRPALSPINFPAGRLPTATLLSGRSV